MEKDLSTKNKFARKIGKPLTVGVLTAAALTSQKEPKSQTNFEQIFFTDIKTDKSQKDQVTTENVFYGEIKVEDLVNGSVETILPFSSQEVGEEEPQEQFEQIPEPVAWPYIMSGDKKYIVVGGGNVSRITGYYCEYIPGYPRGDGGGFCGETQMRTRVREGIAACGSAFRLGSEVYIENIGQIKRCEDTGYLHSHQVDIFFRSNRDLYESRTPEWSPVYIVEPVLEDSHE